MEIKDVANYLLNHCFVMGSCEETREKYYFAIKHMDELRSLFVPLGYTPILYPSPLKVLALVNEYEGTQVKLKKYESIVLLICRLLYLQKRERLSMDGDQVLVTVEEIQQEYQKLNLPQRFEQRKLEEIMRTLRQYNLARPIDKLDNLQAQIEIYPTVVLALPDNVLKASQEATADKLAEYETGGVDE